MDGVAGEDWNARCLSKALGAAALEHRQMEKIGAQPAADAVTFAGARMGGRLNSGTFHSSIASWRDPTTGSGTRGVRLGRFGRLYFCGGVPFWEQGTRVI